jgi:anti-anti-sigma factor
VKTLIVAGELSGCGARELRNRIAAALSESGRGSLVVDLSAVTRVDSAALSALIWAVKTARDGGGRVVLAGTRPEVMRWVRICCLEDMFDFAETADAAIAAEHENAAKAAETRRP